MAYLYAFRGYHQADYKQHQQTETRMERSTCTSVLKWTYIVLNGIGLLSIISKVMGVNGSNPIDKISYLLIVCLLIVAIVFACKENPVWLKRIAWLSLGFGVISLLFGVINFDNDAFMKACLKEKNSPEFCEVAAYFGLLSTLVFSLIHFLMALKLATNLLAEKPTTE